MAVSDMVAIAQSQYGNGGLKYCLWYGFNYIVDWCAIFMSWCADQAGYNLVDPYSSSSNTDDFPRYSVVGDGASWFQSHNRLEKAQYYGGNYVPKRGDIVFFTWYYDTSIGNLDHTGIVADVSNGMVTTIEGNTNGTPATVSSVGGRTVPLNYDGFAYFGVMDGAGSLNVSDDVIAAMCGNFWRESTMNPGIWESLVVSEWNHVYQYDGIGGYGLGGFTNTYQSSTGLYDMRLERYHDWCVSSGYQESDGDATLYYIVFVEKLWAGQYNNDELQEWLQSTGTSLYDLTDEWCRYWEGNPNDHMDERYQNAQNALTYIQQHKNDNPSNYRWISGNFYCSTDQIYNNIMCLYFWFKSHYGGGGGGSKERVRRLKPWMMLRNPALYRNRGKRKWR